MTSRSEGGPSFVGVVASVSEDLYLGALPVTLQRFSFAWQWAAIENAVRQWAGPESTVGQQNNWSLGSTASV